MLRKIKVKGFRSFSQESYEELSLERVTFIVGENSSGKSNLLEAVRFALDPTDEKITRGDFSIRRSKNGGEKKATAILIELTFDSPKKHFPDEALFGFSGKDCVTLKCKATGKGQGNYIKEFFIEGKPIKNISKYKRLLRVEQAKKFLSKINFNISPVIRSTEELSKIKDLLPIQTNSVIRAALKSFSKTVNLAMKKIVTGQLVDFSKKVSLKASLDEKDVVDILKMEMDVVEDFSVPIQNSGQGLISDLLLQLFLRANRDGIVAFEEPEIHMHPNKIRQFIERIRQENPKTQVLLTTHSPLLSAFSFHKEIALVRKMGKYTKIHQIAINPGNDHEISEFRQKLFQQYHATEILFSKGMIFVEGPADSVVYGVAEVIMDLRLKQKGFTIMEMGGAGSYKPYVTLCQELKIPWVLLFDQNSFVEKSKATQSLLFFEKKGWLSKDVVEKNLREWVVPAKRRKNIKALNSQLMKYFGAIYPLPHDDIITAVKILISKGREEGALNDAWFKETFLSLGGHLNEMDVNNIYNEVLKSADCIPKLQTIMENIPKNALNDVGDSLRSAVDAIEAIRGPEQISHSVIKSVIHAPDVVTPPLLTTTEPIPV